MAPRILVADDDPHIRDVICFALEKAGMETSAVGDGAAALRAFRHQAPDLVVLDIGMPELDGLGVCRELRKVSNVPILFLSARDEEIDRVIGLEIGGDDYVTKPFSPRELVARVNAILRRMTARAVPPPPDEAPLMRGLLALDTGRRTAAFDDNPVELTAIEFSIVAALLARPAYVLTRRQLADASHAGQIYVSDRTIDSHVRNIRAKFQKLGGTGIVETVHGVGFRLGRCAP